MLVVLISWKALHVGGCRDLRSETPSFGRLRTQPCVSDDATVLPILWVMDRAELRTHLDHLDDAVPALRASSPDRRHFLRAFVGMAQVIEAKALTSKDAEFVERRIDEILAWHRLTDAEGED